jgi:hypothetical protein
MDIVDGQNEIFLNIRISSSEWQRKSAEKKKKLQVQKMNFT